MKRVGRLLAIAGGFYAAHLAWLGLYAAYAALQSRNQVLGNELPFDPQIWVQKFLQKALWFPLPLAVVVAGIALFILRLGGGARSAWRAFFVGGSSYVVLNAALLVTRPGALISFPFLRRLPFAADFVLLVVASGAVTLWAFWPLRKRVVCCLTWLALHGMLAGMPHDIGRAAWHLFKPAVPEQESSVLVFAIDAARLDSTEQLLPPGARAAVARGVSHFGSTRKQWRLLLTGDEAAVARSFFLPTPQELLTPREPQFLPQQAHRHGLRTAFLIDEPQTLSRATLGIDFDACEMPHEGFFDAIIADSTLFPVCSWLLNILGPVEALNAWSQPAAFRRDVSRALRENQLVFAHTVYLQKNIATIGEFNALTGAAWLLHRPREFALIGEKAQADAGGLDAEIVYRLRLDALLSDVRPWLEQLAAKRGVAAVLTSDHGQEFLPTPDGRSHFAGLHGWSLGPATVWIPFLVYGDARIEGPAEGNLSWLTLHRAIRDWMQNRGPLVLARETGPIAFSSHYIAATHLSGQRQEDVPSDIVTMGRLIRAVRIDPARGAVLDEKFVNSGFRLSEGMAQGLRLRTRNPTMDGGTVEAEWELYQPSK